MDAWPELPRCKPEWRDGPDVLGRTRSVGSKSLCVTVSRLLDSFESQSYGLGVHVGELEK